LEKMVSGRDMNNWWEGVLYSFIDERTDIFHVDVAGAFWTEVDTPADYSRLQDWTSPKKTMLRRQHPLVELTSN
jgi:choline kinase